MDDQDYQEHLKRQSEFELQDNYDNYLEVDQQIFIYLMKYLRGLAEYKAEPHDIPLEEIVKEIQDLKESEPDESLKEYLIHFRLDTKWLKKFLKWRKSPKNQEIFLENTFEESYYYGQKKIIYKYGRPMENKFRYHERRYWQLNEPRIAKIIDFFSTLPGKILIYLSISVATLQFIILLLDLTNR